MTIKKLGDVLAVEESLISATNHNTRISMDLNKTYQGGSVTLNVTQNGCQGQLGFRMAEDDDRQLMREIAAMLYSASLVDMDGKKVKKEIVKDAASYLADWAEMYEEEEEEEE